MTHALFGISTLKKLNMSGAFRGDASIDSAFANNITHPDISLGSNPSSFISPQKGWKTPRLPSTTSAATASSSAPLSTPSPSGPGNFSRRLSEEPNATPLASLHANKMAFLDEADPDPDPTMDTPVLPRTKRGRSSIGGAKGATNLTLREQEKVLDHCFNPHKLAVLIADTGDRCSQEGEFQLEAQSAFPGRASHSTGPGSLRRCVKAEHQPQIGGPRSWRRNEEI